MAVVKLVMKPSALKTLEAQPCNGVAVYLNGSMLNHSCFPTVNRLPFSSCLVVRASRDLFLGEELVCAYTEVRAPFYIRQAELESTWAFRLLCCMFRCYSSEWCLSQADRVARSAWRRFERRRKDGTCSEEELRELVNSTADSTKTALAEFLVAIQDRTEARLKKTNPFCVNYWRRHLLAMASNLMAMASHLIAMSSNLLRMAFYRLLLASFWAAPAFELAFGLQESQRYEEAHQLWLAVRNVTAELLPFSPSHTAAATEASLSAMAAESVAWEEHVQESVRICCGTYGSGAWLRLAAGRLEHLASPTRMGLDGAYGARLEACLEPRDDMQKLAELFRSSIGGMRCKLRTAHPGWDCREPQQPDK
ncbi:unnamed protein product [Durusdinium trenchii]|uniref:SET domain-containing protein n=2 Tax=Durusdinium trenchii TaxID=1381693 RepID=A0ABP0LJU9_9DINO